MYPYFLILITIQLINRLRQRLGLNVSVKDVFTYKNIEGLYDKVISKSFNDNNKMSGQENVTNKINKNDLEYFIQSGIGYGFQMVHKIAKNKIKCFYVDQNYMKTASKVQNVNVYYGGKTGSGKRIDIEITTPKYTLKMNIRDSTGNNNGYPTRIMCDYTYNH